MMRKSNTTSPVLSKKKKYQYPSKVCIFLYDFSVQVSFSFFIFVIYKILLFIFQVFFFFLFFLFFFIILWLATSHLVFASYTYYVLNNIYENKLYCTDIHMLQTWCAWFYFWSDGYSMTLFPNQNLVPIEL